MKSPRIRLFWKLGLSCLLLLLILVAAVDFYAARAVRDQFLRAAFAQLESLVRLAQSRPPLTQDAATLKSWTAWLAESGARVTLVASDGSVLADSQEELHKLENQSDRPEIRYAFTTGTGRAVRPGESAGRDLACLAVVLHPVDGSPVVIRLGLPIDPLDQALGGFRRRVWATGFLIVVLAAGLTLLFFRGFSRRIERLRDFCRRVAAGDFHPLPLDRHRDDLSELSRTLNEAGMRLERTIRTLTEERNQAAAILRSMAEGVAVIGSDQKVVFCNAAFCRALAIEDSWWEGRPLMEVIRQSDLLEVVQKALEGSESVKSEVVIGTLRTKSFAAAAAPVRSNGSAGGAVLVLHDISELRRLERARRDFVANISHEFKTPLTAIQGFAETLLAGALEDEKNSRRFLEIIRDHAARLGRLTDDLLKLAQIEAGKLRMEVTSVSVVDLIEPCLETTRIRADPKQLTLEADYGLDLPEVRADVSSLQEIVQNLLDNAVRYTPAGGRITLRAISKADEVVISISDTGIGIPKVEQERIFERFYRVETARSREMGGTGLGLSIAKHLVEAQGGRIEVDSEVSRGSTFSIFLPCA